MWTRYTCNRRLFGEKMIDEKIFRNVLKELKEHPEHSEDLIDSFSDNQFKSKTKIIEFANRYCNLQDAEVVIFGSWYGSILVPGLSDKVKRITCIDLDNRVLKTSKNRIFKHLNNVDYICADVFEKDRERYWNTQLFINASCEHMAPMKTWPYWPNNTTFICTSNNMYGIEGHINCVDNIEQFKEQMPTDSQILDQDQIQDERGTRFIVVGKTQ